MPNNGDSDTVTRAVILLLLPMIFVEVVLAGGRVNVRGYFRRDGTYVQPHYRTAPDSTVLNNYGYPGNYNPNTGEISGGDPYKALRSYYRVYPQSFPHSKSSSASSSYEVPNLSALPEQTGDIAQDDLNRSQSYCRWLYADRRAAQDCISSQTVALARLVVPDYQALPSQEVSRSAAYCEWLYGDNRAAFYDCFNSQVFGIAEGLVSFHGANAQDQSRATRYCEWLYGNNRASYRDCLESQASALSKPVPDTAGLPEKEVGAATSYCEWLYGDNRGSYQDCLTQQVKALRKHLSLGSFSRTFDGEVARYCAWLYGRNRSSYWDCVVAR
jgi:hypothetical protein